MKKNRAIDVYMDFFDGNQSKAAFALGKKQGHIWHWLNKAKDMPIELVPKAAKIIGRKKSDLRPDFDWAD